MNTNGYLVTVKLPGIYHNIKFRFKSTLQAYEYGLRPTGFKVGVMYKGCYIERAVSSDKNDYPCVDDLNEEFRLFLHDLTSDKQRAWYAGNNGVKDLLTKEELSLYTILGYPVNVYLLERALTKKLEEDPSFELWVPLRYYKNIFRRKDESPCFLETNYTLVSNMGRIVTLKQNFDITTGKDIHGYRGSCYRDQDGKQKYFSIHRAVACCFIAPKFHHQSKGMSVLEVNHKDGVKTNNCFDNLEWVDTTENLNHAIKTGLKVYRTGINRPSNTPLLGEVIIPGIFMGVKFIISGETDKIKYRIKGASSVAAGKFASHKGCKFSYATEDDVKTFDYIDKLPEELLILIAEVKDSRKFSKAIP